MLCLVEVVVVKLQGLTVISLVLPYRAKKSKLCVSGLSILVASVRSNPCSLLAFDKELSFESGSH